MTAGNERMDALFSRWRRQRPRCGPPTSTPVEYFATSRANADPEDTHRLYKALSVRAGVERPVTVERPDVLVDRLVHDKGIEFIWCISEYGRPLSVTPRLWEGSRLTHIGEALPVSIELPRFGVEVCRLMERGE